MILRYLESPEVSEEIRNYNKIESQLIEKLKHEITKYENQNDKTQNDNETQQDVNDLIQLMKATNFLQNSYNFKEIDTNLTQLEGASFEEIMRQLNEKIDFEDFIKEKLYKDGITDEKSILQQARNALYIHSQEQYFELVRGEEKKISGEKQDTEPIKKASTKRFLEIPITLERSNNDRYTTLTVSQTEILFEYLSESEAILWQTKHVDYLKKINKARAIQVLTGYKYGHLTDAMEANVQKKKSTDIREVRKIIEKIKYLISRDLS